MLISARRIRASRASTLDSGIDRIGVKQTTKHHERDERQSDAPAAVARAARSRRARADAAGRGSTSITTIITVISTQLVEKKHMTTAPATVASENQRRRSPSVA